MEWFLFGCCIIKEPSRNSDRIDHFVPHEFQYFIILVLIPFFSFEIALSLYGPAYLGICTVV